jgi:hypothetical protein
VPDPRKIAARPPGNPPQTTGDWKAQLGKWAYELSILKVVTYVGTATVTTDNDGLPASVTFPAGGEPFVTVCNLIGGDISNAIPEKYKDDEGLREFHASQVEKAGQILPNNLKVIGDLVDKVL